jgi:ABC-2 type transport system ATP-binding protein
MIYIKNLSKIKDGRTILDLSEFRVKAGEIIAIIGTTDSGLNILLDLLIGKTPPSSGEITLNKLVPTKHQKKLMENVGVLFREDGLYANQSAEKNLQFFSKLYGLPQGRISETLNYIGLADQAKVRVGKLPTGLARRLAFGRSILHHPSILILVSPFARCDEDTLDLIKVLIHQEADNGTAILILDEDSAYIENVCSRIYFLKQGRIEKVVECGKSGEVDNLPFKIPVKLEGSVALLNPRDILYAEASQGHTLLVTKDSRLPSQFTLQELEERLKRSGFFRAHRSYLVNLQYVREVIPYSRNSFSLKLNDTNRTEIPLSKNSAAELRELLDY